MCFLRLEGRAEEAKHVEETELAEAEAQVRETGRSDPEIETYLRCLHAEEEGRVAEAIAFAEVIVPALSERLAGVDPAPRAPTRPAPKPAPQAKAPGIADFIDEMLANDRAGSR